MMQTDIFDPCNPSSWIKIYPNIALAYISTLHPPITCRLFQNKVTVLTPSVITLASPTRFTHQLAHYKPYTFLGKNSFLIKFDFRLQSCHSWEETYDYHLIVMIYCNEEWKWIVDSKSLSYLSNFYSFISINSFNELII